jgi:c-di-AMP phosphodiesterase-like protein
MRSQTFSKVLSRLTETGFRVFFFACLAFAILSGFYNVWLSLAEIGVVLVLYLYLHAGITRRKKEVLEYLDSVTNGVDSVSRRTMISSPLPIVIFRTDTDDIIWSNDRFLALTGDRDHLFETKLSSLVPGFQSQWLLDGKHTSPDPVMVGDRRYLVFGNLVTAGQEDQFLATTYWVDVTAYAETTEKYQATRPVLAILQVDNYEDLVRGVGEGERALLRTAVNDRVTAWLEPAQGMLCRYDRDHYLLLLEAEKMADLQRRKFSILDEIRGVHSSNGVTATLSIGFGRDGDSPQELFQFASLALDMALSRGGDQVVVKDKENYTFLGGRSKETERRTKVKSRVIASALSELLGSTQMVLIMGHKYPDLDVLGATAGVCAIARKKGVPVHVVRAPSPYPAEAQTHRLASLPEYKGLYISPEEAVYLAGPGTIVVVVDTNRPEQTQAPELLTSGARVIVIDHHRRAASYIETTALSFHDPYASSASELTAELVQSTLDTGDLKREEAEAMLAGIVLDTKNFTMRTGSRTFETAAFLRKSGADTTQVNRFFQHDLSETVAKLDIIRAAQPYRQTIALAATDKWVGRAIAGQAADELLNVAGFEASFVLYPEAGQSCLSARSSGSVNAQVITEMMGGGGNGTTAGAQFPGQTPEEVLPLLKATIDKYFEDET